MGCNVGYVRGCGCKQSSAAAPGRGQAHREDPCVTGTVRLIMNHVIVTPWYVHVLSGARYTGRDLVGGG